MIIFVSFEPGAGGNKFARTVATLPNVYWYSCQQNGTHPWNINSNSNIKGKDISRYHFHRITPWGNIPPTHDLVRDFIPDENFYYEVLFKPRYNWIRKNIKEKYIIIPTHEMPKKLKKHFPDCKVIELIAPIGKNVERYLQTTSEFPAYGRFFDVVSEENEYLWRLQEWGGRQWHNVIKKKDIWSLHRFNRFFEYENDIEEYETYVYNILNNNYRYRNLWREDDVLRFKGDWQEVKTYLNK